MHSIDNLLELRHVSGGSGDSVSSVDYISATEVDAQLERIKEKMNRVGARQQLLHQLIGLSSRNSWKTDDRIMMARILSAIDPDFYFDY